MNDLILYKSENFNGIECDLWKNENKEIFMTAEQLGMVLGYSFPRKAINKIALRNTYLLNEEFSSGTKMVSEAGIRETRVFTEDGIYEVSMLAGTEKAIEFRRWIRIILKGLRKSELILLQTQLEESKPKLEFYNQVLSATNCLTMLQCAKALKMSGRNKLFKFLRTEGILMDKNERHNVPYQQYIEAKYFVTVVKPMFIGKQVVDILVTLVTPRGMTYIKKLLDKKRDLQLKQAQ